MISSNHDKNDVIALFIFILCVKTRHVVPKTTGKVTKRADLPRFFFPQSTFYI